MGMILLINLLVMSVLTAAFWTAVAVAFDKWGVEDWYYKSRFYRRFSFAPPYCMFCLSFWFTLVVVLVVGNYEYVAAPFVVPGLFHVFYK